MRILILGGTIFLGRHLVDAAVNRGHEVTLFNRGQHSPDLFPDIEKLRGDIARMTGSEVSLNIVEVRKPEIDAVLVAENIAQQLERRVGFRRAMKRAVQNAMRLGALGVRVMCGGRLGGAEIARTEQYHEGSVPLHTLRADVQYGTATAMTTYGTCGVKVWVYRGDIMEHDPMAQDRRIEEQQSGGMPAR